MDIKEEAYKWLQENGFMYKGNNASDCMIAAFIAGAARAVSASDEDDDD